MSLWPGIEIGTSGLVGSHQVKALKKKRHPVPRSGVSVRHMAISTRRPDPYWAGQVEQGRRPRLRK